MDDRTLARHQRFGRGYHGHEHILLGLKIMTAQDFKNGIEWPAVVLIGCVFNMAPVIKALAIDKYLGGIFGNVISACVAQPALFITVSRPCCLHLPHQIFGHQHDQRAAIMFT